MVHREYKQVSVIQIRFERRDAVSVVLNFDTKISKLIKSFVLNINQCETKGYLIHISDQLNVQNGRSNSYNYQCCTLMSIKIDYM
jgi:hypothetical protein